MNLTLNRILMHVPRPLPVGMTEFNAWSDRIIALTGPLADTDSLKWTLANKIMQASPQHAYISDAHFVRGLRKAAANQVAAYAVQEIKNKQEAARQAAATQTEATVTEIAAQSAQETKS